jgi:ABC-type spermidine/putrescine transport system permease subunit I
MVRVQVDVKSMGCYTMRRVRRALGPSPGALSRTDSSDAPRGPLNWFAIVLAAPNLAWQLAFFVVPLGFLVSMTFWSVRNFRLQPDFTFSNWHVILHAGFFQSAFIYTFAISLIGSACASLVALPAACALVFYIPAATRRLLVFVLIVPFFTSFPVRIYSMQVFFSPTGLINHLLRALDLGSVSILNTPVGTVIGFLTLVLPLVLLLQTLALGAVDRQLVEAAHNLRCGPVRTFITIILPAARTGLIVAGAFAFILCFGDYISPQFLGGSRPPTLSILIADQVKSGNNWPRASVVAVVMILTLMTVLGAMLRFAYTRRDA